MILRIFFSIRPHFSFSVNNFCKFCTEPFPIDWTTSKYELSKPDWVNEVFFEKVLKDWKKDSCIKVVRLSVTPATLTNDHYGSVMFRTRVEYTSSKENSVSVSFIVKTMPEFDSVKKDMLGDSFVFKTEIRMYSETIPKMEAILRKYGDDTILGPKLIYSAMEPNQVIVLEDLVQLGFTALNTRMPNDKEIEKAMLKLAKWHALSYKLSCEEPESITTYNDGTFNLELDKIDFFTSGIKSFINVVLSSDEELRKYIPYFEEINKTFIENCHNMCNAFKRGDKALFVLNHGDFHYKNIMVRQKESGELDDVLLIDFQMCYYGPAVSDLMYAMYMLLDGETRWNRRDEIISFYFSNFQECLKKFEFKGEIPTMSDLQIDFIKYRQLETVLLATFLPAILAINEDIDKIMESAEFRQKMYLNPDVLKEAKRILPLFLHKGILQ